MTIDSGIYSKLRMRGLLLARYCIAPKGSIAVPFPLQRSILGPFIQSEPPPALPRLVTILTHERFGLPNWNGQQCLCTAIFAIALFVTINPPICLLAFLCSLFPVPVPAGNSLKLQFLMQNDVQWALRLHQKILQTVISYSFDCLLNERIGHVTKAWRSLTTYPN